MNRKLPPDAFAYYASLGPDRSYQAVASHFHVDKKTVVRRAIAEGWQGQLAEIERQAQQNLKERLVSSLSEMNERHLKMLRVVQVKALETLRSMSMRTAIDAVRALDMAVRNERLIVGEPTERTESSIADTIRGEYERWMSKEPEPDPPEPPPAPQTQPGPAAPPKQKLRYGPVFPLPDLPQ